MEAQPFHILLADDGSEHAKAAIQWICDLPLPSGSRVEVLTVFTPRQIDSHLAFQANLENTQKRLQERGLEVETELKAGSPAETILEHADKQKPHLVVLGARGARSTLGILLGGVVQQVVEYGNWPVLVVRAPYQGIHQALLVTDGSEYSQRAAEYLAHFPLPEETEVSVAHVLPPLPPANVVAHAWPVGTEPLPAMPILPTPVETQAWEKEEQEHGRLLVNRAVAALQTPKRSVTPILLRGDAATEIIEYTKKNQVDLIVCGSRGLSPVRSWLLGSVSRKLIHYAGCSMLVVKAGGM
ncbi:MAG: universal stress protein [Anaerolineales bacterium]|nr:universal stress protein [Anaerolineales bacterium]